MSIAFLDRWRARKADPFTDSKPATAETPSCRACSPEDYGPCTCPADCGHLSCTGGWRDVAPAAAARPEYDTRIDVDAKLAELRQQAEAEQDRRDAAAVTTEPWGPWDTPDGLLLDAKALTDGRVAPAFVPEPAPLPPMPFSGISAIWVAQITYPDPSTSGDFDYARRYAEVLRHIGKATGTRGFLESEAAWPVPALETGAAA